MVIRPMACRCEAALMNVTDRPPRWVDQFAADLRATLPGVGFAAELPEAIRMEREYPVLHQEDIPNDDAYRSMDTIRRPVGKLLARSLRVPEAEFLSRVVRIVGGLAGHYAVTWSAASWQTTPSAIVRVQEPSPRATKASSTGWSVTSTSNTARSAGPPGASVP
jgi:hypothetical protein